MQNIRFLSNFLFFISIFILGLYLFHLEATQQIISDLNWHLVLINPIVSGQWKLPHEGFEYTVYVLSKLLRSNYITVSTIFLSIILVIMAYIKFFLLKRLANIQSNLALIFAISLMLVSAICLPMFNSNLYIGQGSPTIWHNPTILCVKPFAFLCVYLAIQAFETFSRKTWSILAILLLISFFYKPNFGIVFIPALGLYILGKYTRNFRAYLYFLLMILPSLLFAFTIQIRNWILLPTIPNSIIVSPFGVLHMYTPNVFISFILATAFPLFFLLINPRRILSNGYLTLSWIMLVIGYLQFAFLAETQCFRCANFAWGFLIALDLVFVFSFIEFIRWLNEVHLTSKITLLFVFGFLTLLYFTHFISGIGYLGRYILTGNFM